MQIRIGFIRFPSVRNVKNGCPKLTKLIDRDATMVSTLISSKASHPPATNDEVDLKLNSGWLKELTTRITYIWQRYTSESLYEMILEVV